MWIEVLLFLGCLQLSAVFSGSDGEQGVVVGGMNVTECCTRSVRKVFDRIFLCEHLKDYNLARLHEPTLNLSAHA